MPSTSSGLREENGGGRAGPPTPFGLWGTGRRASGRQVCPTFPFSFFLVARRLTCYWKPTARDRTLRQSLRTSPCPTQAGRWLGGKADDDARVPCLRPLGYGRQVSSPLPREQAGPCQRQVNLDKAACPPPARPAGGKTIKGKRKSPRPSLPAVGKAGKLPKREKQTLWLRFLRMSFLRVSFLRCAQDKQDKQDKQGKPATGGELHCAGLDLIFPT